MFLVFTRKYYNVHAPVDIAIKRDAHEHSDGVLSRGVKYARFFFLLLFP